LVTQVRAMAVEAAAATLAAPPPVAQYM